MHLHEFLAKVHELVKPKTYLEIGVQHGTSLNLAHAAELAIGVDPNPLVSATGNQLIYFMESDAYFDSTLERFLRLPTTKLLSSASPPAVHGTSPLDLGFIDGLHHYEQALRDFLNMEKLTHRGSVIVIDDVLPRNHAEASRTMCPGDWTGDVWKLTHLLLRLRPELVVLEVNTQPTGTLLVYGFAEPYNGTDDDWDFMINSAQEYMNLLEVPEAMLKRVYAMEPVDALAELKEYLDGVGQEQAV